MKQTATNYLIEQLSLKAMAEHMPWVAKILDTAIEMEKEQIIESYCQGCADIIKDEDIFPRQTSEQYYSDTYESNT